MLQRLVVIACWLLALSVYVACGAPRPDPTIPIPAAAQAVQRVPGTRPIVRFTTQQTPDQVLDWYKQEMTTQGWEVNLEARQHSPAVISFTSAGYRMLFVLDVIAKQGSNGNTSVEATLKPQPAAD